MYQKDVNVVVPVRPGGKMECQNGHVVQLIGRDAQSSLLVQLARCSFSYGLARFQLAAKADDLAPPETALLDAQQYLLPCLGNDDEFGDVFHISSAPKPRANRR